VKVEEVKFISGSEKLRAQTASLGNVEFHNKLPPGTTAKLILRGTLSCEPGAGHCVFTIRDADDVQSID
jgi:hypothetical protein